MHTDLLMEGAGAYTSLAEIAATAEAETPEVTPAISFFTGAAVSITTTMAFSC
uniref:LxmA leader domain family RiPP n=1 Tax=Herbidospora sakaeratensis TaxID=564415 RepID=UPI000ACA3AB6|nr:LxmA leader domain family RiPP [Herbidospora sakaeratensis]